MNSVIEPHPPLERRINAIFAHRCWDKLRYWLEPISEKVELCGSMRRRLRDVGDIDLLIIPKTTPIADLLGTAEQFINHTAIEIEQRAARERWDLQVNGEKYMRIFSRNIQVDIWFTLPAHLHSALVCRTGSTAHNILITERAKNMGMKWVPMQGFQQGDTIRCPASEETFYEMLQLPYIHPTNREKDTVEEIIRAYPIRRP